MVVAFIESVTVRKIWLTSVAAEVFRSEEKFEGLRLRCG